MLGFEADNVLELETNRGGACVLIICDIHFILLLRFI